MIRFWPMFPAFGLLAWGAAGLSEGKPKLAPESGRERELLGALREHGKLAPARAAMENASLAVAEADNMLEELAEGGRLDVRLRGGELFYAPWGPEAGAAARELGGGGWGVMRGGVRGIIQHPRVG